MGNILDNQENFNNYIQNSIIKNDKISHAYLIEINENNNYMEIINEFVIIILGKIYNNDTYKLNKIKRQVYNNCYPDLKIIKPEGTWIKKEQLIDLEREFSKKSMLDNKLIYIIDKAENLNDSSANTILKFLEEPQEGIIAILLTNNKYQVLETIVSRCQTFSLVNNTTETMEINPELMNFINDILNSKYLIVDFDKYLESLFYDKEI